MFCYLCDIIWKTSNFSSVSFIFCSVKYQYHIIWIYSILYASSLEVFQFLCVTSFGSHLFFSLVSFSFCSVKYQYHIIWIYSILYVSSMEVFHFLCVTSFVFHFFSLVSFSFCFCKVAAKYHLDIFCLLCILIWKPSLFYVVSLEAFHFYVVSVSFGYILSS